jgi:hypothetical protein
MKPHQKCRSCDRQRSIGSNVCTTCSCNGSVICEAWGCDRPAPSRGLCADHAENFDKQPFAWSSHRETLETAEAYENGPAPKCKVEGCGKDAKRKPYNAVSEFCEHHWTNKPIENKDDALCQTDGCIKNRNAGTKHCYTHTNDGDLCNGIDCTKPARKNSYFCAAHANSRLTEDEEEHQRQLQHKNRIQGEFPRDMPVGVATKDAKAGETIAVSLGEPKHCALTFCGHRAVDHLLCEKHLNEWRKSNYTKNTDYIEAKNKPSQEVKMIDQAIEDSKAAAYRLAARQFVKAVKEPLLAKLAQKDEGMRAQLAAFLDTDLGAGIFCGMLAFGLTMVPLSMVPESAREHLKDFSKELRVESMTEVGDVIADLLMGPLRDVISNFVANVPKSLPAESSNVTVASVVNVQVEEKVGAR